MVERRGGFASKREEMKELMRRASVWCLLCFALLCLHYQESKLLKREMGDAVRPVRGEREGMPSPDS
jgi:hypothetical protein